MKKKTAIVFGITKDYSFALANVLIGMKKHCSCFWDDIIVYHDKEGLEDSDKQNLNKILPCEFRCFSTEKLSLQVDEGSLKQYSLLTMARFECFQLLEEYENVIWHDVDILIQKDFYSLLGCAESTGFALTYDSNFFVEQNFFAPISGYKMMLPLHNAGIMVLKDCLKDYQKLTEYCYRTFNQYASQIRYFDQAVLNMMIQDFDIEVGYIDLDIYCCHPSKKASKDAVIVHAYGAEKFWNCKELKTRFPEWENNHQVWEEISKGIKKQQTHKTYESVLENPKISVLMSVYERTDYLEEAVESILSQTYENFEFLIVIEKSKTQMEIRDNLRRKYSDKRIVLLCNEERLGFANSLNRGIKYAKGEFIARMDDDDISLPERFQKQVQFLEEHPNISVVGSYIKMFMNSNQLCKVPLTQEELKVRALNETPIYHPTVMFRRQDFLEHQLYYDPDYMTEDYELWCRALSILNFANLPEVLLLYRASGKNATVLSRQKVLDSHIAIVQRNFKAYLKIELSYDEALLLEQPQLIEHCFNADSLNELREEAIIKIQKANEVLKVFDNKLLKERFFTYQTGILFRLRRRIKKYPFLFKAAKRCYGIIKR